MTVVVAAGRRDATARAFAERHAARGVALLTPADLSRPGWTLHVPGATGRSRAVVAGEAIGSEEIAGVVVRLPRVAAEELTWIVRADRAYVAAEMTAFLLAWLSDLTCPVLNQPAPPGLAAPNWWPERWTLLAARLGIPARPVHHRVEPGEAGEAGARGPDPECPLTSVTVVGDRCFGSSDRALTDAARRIAAASGADLLAVRFAADDRGPRFAGADPWPDLLAPEVGDAVLAHLTGRGA